MTAATYTTTSEPQTVQQAYAQAKGEQSATDQAQPAAASTDASPEATPAQDTDKAAGAPPASAEPTSQDLVSDAEFADIQARFPGDPAKQRAELNKAFTQKTQKIAPYAKFIKAYEANPAEAVKALAQQHGISIADAKAAVEPTTTATTAAATIADQAIAAVKQTLGPELDFLAEPIGRAMHQVAELVAKTVTEQSVKPLQEQQNAITTKAAQEQVDAVMATFAKDHPDWKTHEAAMEQLATKVKPNGMGEREYLELLYNHVTYESRLKAESDKAAKAAIEKMTKAAEGAETRMAGQSDGKVITDEGANTIHEAFAMAKRDLAKRTG